MRAAFVATTAALAVLASALFAPIAGAVVISFTNAGTVVPGAGCPPPPSLPLDCAITASGNATDVGGTYGPWLFQALFTLHSAGQPSPTQYLSSGTFLFDDPTPANNDIAGTLTGVFDVVTFNATIAYTITGGAGAFASASGFGSGLVQLNPQDFTYVETGRLAIPEPATLALLIGALLPVIPAFARRARTSRLSA